MLPFEVKGQSLLHILFSLGQRLATRPDLGRLKALSSYLGRKWGNPAVLAPTWLSLLITDAEVSPCLQAEVDLESSSSEQAGTFVYKTQGVACLDPHRPG
jgi:hypothetical protein